MRRRDFIKVVAGSASFWPLAARAQQPAMPVIGFLHGGSADAYAREASAFRQGLRETGYIDGQNVAIEYRWAKGQYSRLPALAADLVRQRVAVIAALSFASTLAARAATDALPIVFEHGVDPVRIGLVASLNRPGSNITGIISLTGELIAKKIELMHEVVPNSALIAVLVNPGYPTTDTQITDARAAQTSLGIKIQILQASTLSEIEAAFAKVVELRIGGLVITGDPYFHSEQQQIAALATRYSVPTLHYIREFVAAGGLMSYGPDYAEAYRLVGGYTGRILKGEKPADLPVQRSTKVELFINLKTAKALGLTLPEPLLGRADEVIE